VKKKMKKGDKAFWISWLVGIVISIIIVITIATPSYSEKTKDILSPMKYKIVNDADGIFLKLSSYHNPDALKMGFDNLKKRYDNVLANETFSIVVLDNATVVYQWDYCGETFISQNNYMEFRGGRDANVIEVSGGDPITIKIAWRLNPGIIWLLVLGVLISLGVSLAIGRAMDETFLK